MYSNDRKNEHLNDAAPGMDADAARLAALEDADETLTPLLASIVSHYLASKPLPPH